MAQTLHTESKKTASQSAVHTGTCFVIINICCLRSVVYFGCSCNCLVGLSTHETETGRQAERKKERKIKTGIYSRIYLDRREECTTVFETEMN